MDGLEILLIRISGLFINLFFNVGMNLGGGVWQFIEVDLFNFILNLSGSYIMNVINFMVQVMVMEVSGGFMVLIFIVVMFKVLYMIVDVIMIYSGSYIGSLVNEYIIGGNGVNIISVNNGNNIVFGGVGDDNLLVGVGFDVLMGGSGDDIFNVGLGMDLLVGGFGNDLMSGGDVGENFVDVFVWLLGDQGVVGMLVMD